jgi:hypothetical protein
MGQGENDMVVVAGQQTHLLRGEPVLGLDKGALRAGAVSARVVPDAAEVSFGACLEVAAQGGGAARHDGLSGFAHV